MLCSSQLAARGCLFASRAQLSFQLLWIAVSKFLVHLIVSLVSGNLRGCGGFGLDLVFKSLILSCNWARVFRVMMGNLVSCRVMMEKLGFSRQNGGCLASFNLFFLYLCWVSVDWLTQVLDFWCMGWILWLYGGWVRSLCFGNEICMVRGRDCYWLLAA